MFTAELCELAALAQGKPVQRVKRRCAARCAGLEIALAALRSAAEGRRLS